ncbi:pectate lyase [uncultured Selenomonas sp.]|uniref:pectate lyase family protein n=1 Tax=uncultured Selenomonas sp. TaxID=159275 RepID=UPI0028DBCBF1|nr:pectate lyase [uncultured Selenomonas sp.]
MKKKLLLIACIGALAAIFLLPLVQSSMGKTDFIREVLAKNDGFAAEGSGTTGGAAAVEDNIFRVTNRQEFIAALGNRKNTEPRILMIYGTIDFDTDADGKHLTKEDYMAEGYDFQQYLDSHAPHSTAPKSLKEEQEEKRKQSQKNQAKNIMVHVPANTSIIGIEDAKLKGVDLVLDADNIIIRNIMFESPYDYFPSWDPNDGPEGNWNSQYDSITIRGGTHIWIDHCHFEDGTQPTETYFHREYEHRDGLVDITNQADDITMSYNVFERHNKTILIGSSDAKTADDGKLNVTLHHNYFHNLVQRAPRVRWGKVHVYNNYYQTDDENGEYRYAYSLGVGKNSKIYAENNVADIDGRTYQDFVKVFGGTELTTLNNIFNGEKIDTFNEHLSPVTWTPDRSMKIDDVNEVKAKVLQQAGVFKEAIIP